MIFLCRRKHEKDLYSQKRSLTSGTLPGTVMRSLCSVGCAFNECMGVLWVLSRCTTSGSTPFAHAMSTFSKPRAFWPLALTAPNAAWTFWKVTSAVANLGGLVGCFLGGLIERSIEFSSSAPNGRSKAASAVAVESSGLAVVVNLTRTVKSVESWQSPSVNWQQKVPLRRYACAHLSLLVPSQRV